ncbi:MerR family transcriptional regulator [Mesorhizobium amorphae]|uniref:MerR family transcriptional regulator n=1 Tax=Mesorhizobium amorphae TaxID=71433 RepID=UPI0011841D56|nr:helix-turn-helix domain-containing protein [Mesorhizobium amorphae]
MNLHTRILTIGALAKAAGVSTPTVRYYEDIGLLPKADRTSGGQRNYSDEDVGRLVFIRQCRDFGFGIDQVRVLLDLSISGERDCSEARDIAKTHLAEVQERLAELRMLEKRLADFVQRCDISCAGGSGQDCVIFKDMSKVDRRSCC